MPDAPGWWRLWLARTHATPSRPQGGAEHEREADDPLSARLALHQALGNRAAERLSGLDDGRALPPALRATLESRLGHPLDGVRVHDGPPAARIAAENDATALATGEDIVLGAGAPAPGSAEGDHLLAHEVAHTAQQRKAVRPGVSTPGDQHERAAETFAAGEALRPAGPAPALQRQAREGALQPRASAVGGTADADAAVQALRAASDDGNLATLSMLLQRPGDMTLPAVLRAAIVQLQSEGIPLAQVVFERLDRPDWSAGLEQRVDARSRWVDTTPHIALGRGLLDRLAGFLSDPAANLAEGLAVLRTVAHELRHLARERPGRQAPSAGRTVLEHAMVREGRRLHMTPQQALETDYGRDVHRLTAYPAEELLARLAELAIVRIEYNAARGRGTASPDVHDRFEERVQTIAYWMRYALNQLLMATQTGVEGMGPADYARALEEIEREVLARYGPSSDELRLWRLVRAGGGQRITYGSENVHILERVFP